MARSRAKLVEVVEPDNDGAQGIEHEELFEEPEAPQVVTTVSVPRSSPPSFELPLFPGLPAATARAAVKLLLRRVTPSTHAGYLGASLGVRATEEDIRRTYGGRVFEVELRDAMGRTLSGGMRTVEIEADPKRPDGESAHTPAVDVGAVAARVRDEFKEELERLRAQARIDAEEREAKAKRELELERQRRKDEQDERDARAKREREAEEARHKRDLEMMREASKAERERERERHDADMRRMEQASKDALAMQREMTTLILKSQEENTKIVVASLNAKGGGIEQFAQVAEVLNALKGDGEDPSVKIVGKLSEGLSSFAKLAGADRGRPALRAGPGVVTRPPPSPAPVATSRPVAPNPAPAASAPAAGEPALPPPSAATVPEDLKVIAADWMTQGADPAEIVRGLREGRYVVVPADELEEIDDPDAPAAESSPAAAATAPNGAPS